MKNYGKVVQLTRNHPLVGTWIGDEDDARAEFTVCANGSSFDVSGVDCVDGEVFEIFNVMWDGVNLEFTSLMPSTGRKVFHIFHPLPDGCIQHDYTFNDREIRYRKKSDGE